MGVRLAKYAILLAVERIIPDNLPPHDYKDHSDYIRQVLNNNESVSLSIHHISDLLKHYSKDSSSTG